MKIKCFVEGCIMEKLYTIEEMIPHIKKVHSNADVMMTLIRLGFKIYEKIEELEPKSFTQNESNIRVKNRRKIFDVDELIQVLKSFLEHQK